MTPRAASAKSPIGIAADRAALALWYALAASGIAPAVAAAAAGAVFARLIAAPRHPQFLHHAASRCSACSPAFHRARDRRELGVLATGSNTSRRCQPLVRVLAPLPESRSIRPYPHPRLRRCLQDRAGRGRCLVSDPARDLSRHVRGRAKLVWSARAAGASPRPALFTVVLMAAMPSVLTGCRIGLHHLVHRGVPRRDDHLHRRPRLSPGAARAQLPDRRHVRAADLDLDSGADAECGVQCAARAAC